MIFHLGKPLWFLIWPWSFSTKVENYAFVSCHLYLHRGGILSVDNAILTSYSPGDLSKSSWSLKNHLYVLCFSSQRVIYKKYAYDCLDFACPGLSKKWWTTTVLINMNEDNFWLTFYLLLNISKGNLGYIKIYLHDIKKKKGKKKELKISVINHLGIFIYILKNLNQHKAHYVLECK